MVVKVAKVAPADWAAAAVAEATRAEGTRAEGTRAEATGGGRRAEATEASFLPPPPQRSRQFSRPLPPTTTSTREGAHGSPNALCALTL